jgi:putative colanic acid biosynthesis acetyltransferase WcaF
MTVLDARVCKTREGGASFSVRHRLERLIWSAAWTLLASWTPVPMHGWRRLLARAFGAKVAGTAKIYPDAKIWYPRNLSLAEYSCLGPGVDCYCMDSVSLGCYALVSQGATLCGGTHDIDQEDFQLKVAPIVIADHAWIAARAFVGPGVTVNEGAVLGACGVSFHDLEAWTVFAGNPAKKIRMRRR